MSKKTIYIVIFLILAGVIGVSYVQLDLIQTGMMVSEQQYDKAFQTALNLTAEEIEQREQREIDVMQNGYTASNAPLTSKVKGGAFLNNTRLSFREDPSISYRLETPAQFAAKDLSERVNRDFLGKILEQELKDAGIKERVEYGVYDNRTHKFIIWNGRPLTEAGSDTNWYQGLMTDGYSVSLFEGHDDEAHGTLFAISLDKDNTIFRSVGGNLLASLFFVCLIIGCFGYTIYVVLRQKKVSEMKTDFINNMTHEFKTPIATISLATDSISSPRIAGHPDKVRRFAKIIKQENKRMNDQVEKVLQMAKLDKSQLSLNLTAVDLHEVIRDAVGYIMLQVEPRGGSVTMNLTADPAIVEADNTHISSLINNLLDNANKYSVDAPKIQVSTRNLSRGVEVTVKDHGIGMSREARKNIFDRFYRVHTGDRHDVKGFGLGLSYVKTITDAHKGSVTVKSELGKGSSFIVFLPYRQD